MKIKKYKKFLIPLILFSIILTTFILYNNKAKSSMENDEYTSYDAENIDEDVGISDLILVYMTGAIEEPGLYEVESGTNVYELIDKAGGLLPYANKSDINMAAILDDHQHIHIQFKFKGNPEELLRKEKINLNRAKKEDLVKIKGVGPSTADKIIEYRDKNKGFKEINEITNVKGIGPKMFEKMKCSICV